MMAKKKVGRLITLEGIEGAGKTTQIVKIQSFLKKNNIKSIITREPGGTHALSEIRRTLLFSEGMSPLSETFMLMADRAQHVREIITPSLNEGVWVISDRYSDASLAYQGYGKGVDLALIRKLNNEATQGITPNITFLLDLGVSTGLERARVRLAEINSDLENKEMVDRFEAEPYDFHLRVKEGYLKLAQENTRFVIIDAERDASAIFEDIRSALLARLVEK